MTSSSSLHVKISARVAYNRFPILHVSTYLYNLPLKLNTVPLVILSRRRLKIAWEAMWGSLCCLYIWSKMRYMVSSKGILVNREVTSYETRISSSGCWNLFKIILIQCNICENTFLSGLIYQLGKIILIMFVISSIPLFIFIN